jgi:hypothetical protein
MHYIVWRQIISWNRWTKCVNCSSLSRLVLATGSNGVWSTFGHAPCTVNKNEIPNRRDWSFCRQWGRRTYRQYRRCRWNLLNWKRQNNERWIVLWSKTPTQKVEWTCGQASPVLRYIMAMIQLPADEYEKMIYRMQRAALLEVSDWGSAASW